MINILNSVPYGISLHVCSDHSYVVYTGTYLSYSTVYGSTVITEVNILLAKYIFARYQNLEAGILACKLKL